MMPQEGALATARCRAVESSSEIRELSPHTRAVVTLRSVKQPGLGPMDMKSTMNSLFWWGGERGCLCGRNRLDRSSAREGQGEHGGS